MRDRNNQIHLSKKDAAILRQHCRGCRFFIVEKDVSDICTLVGWYDGDNIKEIESYVKQCPCNKKCLVKPSCREENCPIWMKKLEDIVKDRNSKKIGWPHDPYM